MITEDYVSFETAKLLKEKGFDEYCKSVYHVGSVCSVASLGYHNNEGYGELIEEKQNSDFGKYDNAISAPTLQMAMKWLREVHNLECDISFNPYSKASKEPPYWMSISTSKFDNPYHSSILWKSLVRTHFDTYEEACEAAIKYCLENLI
jgi:hypothetical protein